MNEAAGSAFKPLPCKRGCIIYQITRGETLGRIANHFGCTVNDLLKWNPRITDKNRICCGNCLYIRQSSNS